MNYTIARLLSLGSSQIRFVLNRGDWGRVSIREGGEPMVTVAASRKLVLVPAHAADGVETSFEVRSTVAEMLARAAALLPDGISLGVIEGFRSLEKQQRAWDVKCRAVKAEHPEWDDARIEGEVRMVVAKPGGVTNHVCGGAVDVCLVRDGTVLDCGTGYAPSDEASRRKVAMFARGLTARQRSNRRILRRAMESAGFVWYPGEWWHYCYGDRMWAVYMGKAECPYGPVSAK